MTSAVKSYTPMQQQLLTRLNSLARDRRTATTETRKLLDFGIYGTLADCRDFGIGAEASEIIKKYQPSEQKA